LRRASGREAKAIGSDAVAKSGGTARPSANQRFGLAFFLLTPKPMTSPLPNEAQLVIVWSVHGRVSALPAGCRMPFALQAIYEATRFVRDGLREKEASPL